MLLGAVSVLACIAAYVGDEPAALLRDATAFVMGCLGLIGALIIIVSKRAWAYLTSAILIGLLPLAGLVTVMRFHLVDPLSGRPFIGALFAVLALILVVPAGIRGRRNAQASRHTPSARGWRSRHGTFVIATSALVLGAIYAGGIASIAAKVPIGDATDFTAQEVDAEQILLETRDFDFQPRNLTVVASKLTELRILNRDAEFHTFTYRKNGTEHNHNLLAGAEATVWLFFPEPGLVAFRCTPHSDGYDDVDDMVGTINVVAAPGS